MIKIDLHTHTNFSKDSKTDIEDHVKAAIERNVTHLAITDHVEFSLKNSSDDQIPNVEEYFRAIETMQARYGHEIQILKGAEIGMQPMALDRFRNYVRSAEFDFIIGSIHVVDGRNMYTRADGTEKNPLEVVKDYFFNYCECAHALDEYCVLGHLDLFFRYRPYVRDLQFSAYARYVDELLRIVIAKDRGIELNLAGRYSYGMHGFNPSMAVLARYKELGGRILTIGSDAHRVANIALMYDDAIYELRKLGYNEICTFERMNPMFHRI